MEILAGRQFATNNISSGILYFVYLKEFVGLRGWRFIGAGVFMGVFILLMAAVSGYLGIKTPII